MKLITTSALALSLLVTAAPLAAFADDSANVSGNVQVQTNDGSGKGNPLSDLRDGLRGLLGGKSNASIEGDIHGQGNEAHMNASSTNPGMHRGPGMGSTTPKMGIGTQARGRGDTEIDSRIANLNKMIARLGDATRLSSDAKASLTAELNAQITALTDLKAQINADATTTLKTDVQSITKDFRIYALVMPKAAIDAAADRVMTIAAQMETLSGKITTRITAAQAAGTDVSAAVTAHTDFDAKVADAKVQATAAVNEVANLTVDAGATTTLAANTTALKDAKTKIDAAQADLKAARADVNTILKAIKGKGEVQATTTASAQ
ncbi:MAG TPA: hypothetical protein VGN56_02610 [Candidatus Paceibacterota bacterium]|jgi:hypothetical protein|nr:hypothetical protein [Candidatus Paceibacterota bacterium]